MVDHRETDRHTEPAAREALLEVGRQFKRDNPSVTVVYYSGAVWIRAEKPGAGLYDWAVYSAAICGKQIVRVIENGVTVLHQPAAKAPEGWVEILAG